MKNQKAFTLIELLVVVLIIGILAAVALPQYQKAVEKARTTEALSNMKALEKAIDIFLLENGGFPQDQLELTDFLERSGIELSGGEFDDGAYYTKNFQYSARCSSFDCEIFAFRLPYEYELYIEIYSDRKQYQCLTVYTDLGKSVCKQLEPLGWAYSEGEV